MARLSTRRQVFEIVSTLVVAASAVAVVGMQAYRFLSTSARPQHTQVEGWREKSASGIWIGRRDAEFVVTTFIDFTCPYCRAFAPVLDSLTTDLGDRVAIAFHHYPLSRTWSVPSAIAAECASRQARFHETARVLYGEVAAAGNAPPDWAAIAQLGGVPRIDDFLECMALPGTCQPP